jgi:hypothetical protein
MNTRLKKLGSISFVAAFLLGGNNLAARAGFPIGNSVTIGGTPVFSIAGSVDGYSAQKRAHLAQDALDNAIASSEKNDPDCVALKDLNGSSILTLNGQKITTVDLASATAEKKTLAELGQCWQTSLKDALSDRGRIAAYRAGLLANNPIQSTVVRAATRVTKDEMTLPVAFNSVCLTKVLGPGDNVTAMVNQPFKLGAIPVSANSELSGTVERTSDSTMLIVFNKLTTADGSEYPIRGTLCRHLAMVNAPHPVSTFAIPAGQGTDARVPATVAIGGAAQGDDLMVFNLTPGSDLSQAPYSEFVVAVEHISPIASVQNGL